MKNQRTELEAILGEARILQVLADTLAPKVSGRIGVEERQLPGLILLLTDGSKERIVTFLDNYRQSLLASAGIIDE